jgi:hypothetical protein
MLEIDINTKDIELKLQKMFWKIQRLKQRQIGMEMSEWQQEDVHRRRPYTKRNRRAGIAQTLFRPHSRFEMRNRRKLLRRAERQAKKFGKKKALPVVVVPIRRWSTRPILRAIMIERLHERMKNLVSEKLKW